MRLDRFTWWKRLFVLVICTLAFITLVCLVLPGTTTIWTWLGYAVGVSLWVVSFSYEVQYLYKVRKEWKTDGCAG